MLYCKALCIKLFFFLFGKTLKIQFILVTIKTEFYWKKILKFECQICISIVFFYANVFQIIYMFALLTVWCHGVFRAPTSGKCRVLSWSTTSAFFYHCDSRSWLWNSLGKTKSLNGNNLHFHHSFVQFQRFNCILLPFFSYLKSYSPGN